MKENNKKSEAFAQDFGNFHHKVLSIRTELDMNKAVDLTLDPNKYVNIWDFHGGENQQWEFIYDSSERSYQIISISTKKALRGNPDGSMDMVKPTESFEEYDYYSYWQVHSYDSSYLLKNMGSGWLLDLNNEDTTNGNRIKTYPENGSRAQYWKLIEIERNSNEFDGKIVTLHSDLNWEKVIDIGNDTYHPLNIWDFHGKKTQSWRFQYDSIRDAYQIISVDSGFCIDANSSGGIDLISTIYQFLSSYWKIEREPSSGRYMIENAESKLVIGITGSATSNGTEIAAFPRDSNRSQLWYIEENAVSNFDGETVVIRALESSSQVLDLQLQDDSYGTPTQEIILYEYREDSNQKWVLGKNSDGSYHIVSSYIYNPSGIPGAESSYWLTSTENKPAAPNITLSILDGGKSEWHLIPMQGAYDYDGYPVFAFENASQPGNFLKYDGISNSSSLSYATGEPAIDEKNKLFSIEVL